MKNIIGLFCLTLLTIFQVHGQDNDAGADPGPGAVTVYSEDGDNFTLYLNGARINANPDTRVVANNVKEVPVSFRIVMEKSASEIKKNGIRQGTNCTYAIAKNKKGEYVLKMRDCTNEPVEPAYATTPSAPQNPVRESTEPPAQLAATYADGVISINDGRTLRVTKVKAHGMTYPQLFMNAPAGAKVSIAYDANNEQYSAEVPLKYEVKDFSNNNAYFTLTVDEGGPAKTWKVKLQHANGFDIKIE